MALDTTENAIRTWIKAASGLADENIRWWNQKVEFPTGPFVTMQITAIPPRGAYDTVSTNYDADRPVGQEIEQLVIGERELNLSVQVHRGEVVGANSAMALATRIALGVRLPSINEALNEAGVAPFDIGGAQDLAVLLGSTFSGRASVDARFNIRETVSEFTTYIQTVVMVESLTGLEITIEEE